MTRFLHLLNLLWLLAFGATCATISPSASAQKPKFDKAATEDYLVAAQLQNNTLYAEAEKHWKKFIKNYPDEPRLANVYHNLGACYLKQAKFDEAAQTFRHILKEFPKFDSLDAAQFNLALTLYNKGRTSKKKEDFQSAAQEFGLVASKYPESKNSPVALFYQGECLYLATDLTAAVEAYQKLISKYPDHPLQPDAYYSLGTTQQDLKKYDQAAKTFRNFLDKFEKNELANECQLRLAQSLFDQGDYKEATKLFEKTAQIKDFPYASYALMQQGQCLYELKDYDDAARVYDRFPGMFSGNRLLGQALLSAGKCWYLANNDGQARNRLEQVIDRKFPEAPEAAYWLGQALIRGNNANEAVSVTDQAIKAYPKSEFVPHLEFVRLSAMYEQPKQRKDAAKLFAEFSQKYPDHELTPRALYMAALASLEQNQFVDSQKHAENFLAQEKNKETFKNHEVTPEVLFIAGEAYLLADKKNHAKAEPFYRRLVQDHPESKHVPKASLRVGLCLYLADKKAESINYLKQAASKLEEDSLQAEAYFLIGRSYSDAQKPDPNQAITALEKSLQIKDDWDRSDEVLLTLAENLRAVNRTDDAIDRLKQLNGSFSKSAYRDQALYSLGELYYQKKEYQEARNWYRKVPSNFSKSSLAPLAQHGIGLTEFAEGHYEEAVREFAEQIDKYAQSEITPLSYFWRGLAQQQRKQFEAAQKDLQAFLQSERAKTEVKKVQDARFALGFCQVGLEKYEDAAQTFQSLLKDHPNYDRAPEVYYEMGYAWKKAEQLPQAVQAFEDLAKRFPESPLAPESWLQVGQHQENQKEFADAAEAYASGLAIIEKVQWPDNKAGTKAKTDWDNKLRYKLGYVQYRQNQWADAAATLEKQIELYPKGKLANEAAYLAGICWTEQKEYGKAIPLFEKVIAFEKDLPEDQRKWHAKALYRCGSCQGNLQQWPQSEQHYAQLIQQYPEFELLNEGRYGQAWALKNLDKNDEALEILEKIVQDKEEKGTELSAKSRFLMGQCEFAEKEYQKAIDHFLRAKVSPYKEWRALSHLEEGRCLYNLKKIDKAIETIQSFIKKYPDHPDVEIGKSILEKMLKDRKQANQAFSNSAYLEIFLPSSPILTLARS